MTITTAPAAVPDLLGTSPADLLDAEAPVATLDEARGRAERIRAGLESYTQMRQDIADAFARRDWLALDYPSWFTYLEGEYGSELRRLTRDERREAIADLRGQGMSTRQIASATGVDQKTVRDDLQVRGNPSPAAVTGTDGKTYAAKRPERPPFPGPADAEPSRGLGGDLRDHVLAVLRPDEDDAWGLGDICSRLPGYGEPGQVRPGEVREVLAVLVEAGRAGVGRDSDGQYWWKAGPKPTPSSPATPEQVEATRLDVERKQAIAAGQRTARNLLMEVRGRIVTVVSAIDLGEKGLINEQLIADLRAAVELLASRLEASK